MCSSTSVRLHVSHCVRWEVRTQAASLVLEPQLCHHAVLRGATSFTIPALARRGRILVHRVPRVAAHRVAALVVSWPTRADVVSRPMRFQTRPVQHGSGVVWNYLREADYVVGDMLRLTAVSGMDHISVVTPESCHFGTEWLRCREGSELAAERYHRSFCAFGRAPLGTGLQPTPAGQRPRAAHPRLQCREVSTCVYAAARRCTPMTFRSAAEQIQGGYGQNAGPGKVADTIGPNPHQLKQGPQR